MGADGGTQTGTVGGIYAGVSGSVGMVGSVMFWPVNTLARCCCVVTNVMWRSYVSAVMVLMMLFSTRALSLFAICICVTILVMDPTLLLSTTFVAP